jgi:WD40 repeat protein
MTEACVIAAHDGRVNALRFDYGGQLLFSASHDGSIKCWSLTINSPRNDADALEQEQLNDLLLVTNVAKKTIGPDIHVTCLASVNKRSNYDDVHHTLTLFAGTNNGTICTLALQPSVHSVKRATTFKLTLLKKQFIRDDHGRFDLKNLPVVNTLCPFTLPLTMEDDPLPFIVVVGHSRGLGYILEYMNRGSN